MEEQRIVNATERANSYEFGKAGSRFKIYYEHQNELMLKIKECIEADTYRKKLQGDFDE